MNSNNDSIRNNCVIKINTVVNNHDLSRNIELRFKKFGWSGRLFKIFFDA